MAYASDVRSINLGISDRISAFLKSFTEARELRRVYARTLNELQSLNERELLDLGISSAQIPFIARQAAYGDE